MMIRPIIEKICKLPEGMLPRTVEIDEGYVPAASKECPWRPPKKNAPMQAAER